VPDERPLQFDGGFGCRAGPFEGSQHSVTGRFNELASMQRHKGAQDIVVDSLRIAHLAGIFLPEGCAFHDVGEDKGKHS
jgi:hypothetical protein